MGTFPRVTHPSATDPRRGPFDLHVLGLPPAFVLSQDQTLNLKADPTKITAESTEVPHPPAFPPVSGPLGMPLPAGSRQQTAPRFRNARSVDIPSRLPKEQPARTQPSTLLFPLIPVKEQSTPRTGMGPKTPLPVPSGVPTRGPSRPRPRRWTLSKAFDSDCQHRKRKNFARHPVFVQ